MLTPEGAQSQPLDGFASMVNTTDERRTDERQPRQFAMRLTAMGESASHDCTCVNVSEGGCFTQLPADAGLMVGQRCELEFIPAAGHADASHLAGEICYATVVRTESVTGPTGPAIGTGLRFDQPLFF